jgi:hypothetical protein
MKRLCALSLACLLISPSAFAGVKTYQVTGPVLEVKDDVIVVQKGSEKWEIAKSKDTKVKGDIKVGAKVTVMYTMSAASIEVKSK